MNESRSPRPVVEVQALTRCFGQKRALDNVSLSIPQGCVFGLVGENGAGKTTLLRHLLGSLRPENGTVRVLGLDPIQDLVKVLSRIGYLSASPELPSWMRVGQLLAFTRPFYTTWDADHVANLVQMFDIDLRAKVKTLSTGQTARVGLVLAMAHRPELLILDEPSAGLDPIVRRDILEAIISSIADRGSTVVFSSHLLDEVERVSDRLAMIRNGRILECDELGSIKHSYRVVTLNFETQQPTAPRCLDAIHWQGGGREWTGVCRSIPDSMIADVTLVGGRVVDQRVPTLDEIFLAYTKQETKTLAGEV